ncbi:MAG: glycosyltransferase [Anaerolineae bacterium]|nr:glycosyltransferase [Anaerolineae bacterium]
MCPSCAHSLHNRSSCPSFAIGFGSAYIAGFKEAIATNTDYVVQMDADLSHQPVYVPQMITAAQHSDVVIGSRYTLGGSVDESWSAFRKFSRSRF